MQKLVTSRFERWDAALAQFVILGLTTNVQFLRDIMQHPVFELGEATTHFVDDYLHDWQSATQEPAHAALIAAAVGELLSKSIGSEIPQQGVDGDVYSPWNRSDAFRMV